MPASDRLLLSIHDVGPGFAVEVDRLAALLAETAGAARFAMLVVPDHWGRHPLVGNAAFCRRLRDWAEQGVELFVHGWFHRDEARHGGAAARLRARHMTAGEGEFLGLSHAEAARRMQDGKALLEDITGMAPAGFIAPAWLYGPGARAALAESGFALAEDHWRVWQPASGQVLARGPVVTWASRSPLRTASSLAFAALARTALQPLPVVRVAVHPGDVTKDRLLADIRRTVATFTRRRTPARYADLAA